MKGRCEEIRIPDISRSQNTVSLLILGRELHSLKSVALQPMGQFVAIVIIVHGFDALVQVVISSIHLSERKKTETGQNKSLFVF